MFKMWVFPRKKPYLDPLPWFTVIFRILIGFQKFRLQYCTVQTSVGFGRFRDDYYRKFYYRSSTSLFYHDTNDNNTMGCTNTTVVCSLGSLNKSILLSRATASTLTCHSKKNFVLQTGENESFKMPPISLVTVLLNMFKLTWNRRRKRRSNGRY